jgi:hypothetical protein
MNRMKKKKIILLQVFVILILLTNSSCQKVSNKANAWHENQWTIEKVNSWYDKQGWITGCNYTPSTAGNSIEMWHKDTYDAATIDKELGWAKDLGFNSMRVFIHSLVWQHDAEGLKERINDYLSISTKHGIKTMFVLFDDCWNPEGEYGIQPEPQKGVHNSLWVQDPIVSQRADTATLYKTMEHFVKDILETFKNDERVQIWDLYNEPGNSKHLTNSLPLLRKVFLWAREVNPSQPLTSGIWRLDFYDLNKFQLENSDVVSYHCYHPRERHQDWIYMMNAYKRPVLCTEWMGRRFGSTFEEIMPILKNQNIGSYVWGFVAGKTNTIFAWDDPQPDGKEPQLWFHDILRVDGSPYSVTEIETIKSLTKINK